MAFPRWLIQRLRTDEALLIAVAREHVELKELQTRYAGLCPIHPERTPSFYIPKGKSFFHCFGCGAGGSVIDFVMYIQRMDYPDAVKYLARRAGFSFPPKKTGGSRQ